MLLFLCSELMAAVPLFKEPSHFSKPRAKPASHHHGASGAGGADAMFDGDTDADDLDYNPGGVRGGGGGGGGGWGVGGRPSSPRSPSEANEWPNDRLRRSNRSVMQDSEADDDSKKKKEEEFDPGTHFLMDAYLYTPPPRTPVLNEKWIEEVKKQAEEENQKVAKDPLYGRVNAFNQPCYACENHGDKCTNYSGDSDTWNVLNGYMNDLTKPPHLRCRLSQDYYNSYVVDAAQKHMTVDMWYDHMFFHEI